MLEDSRDDHNNHISVPTFPSSEFHIHSLEHDHRYQSVFSCTLLSNSDSHETYISAVLTTVPQNRAETRLIEIETHEKLQ